MVVNPLPQLYVALFGALVATDILERGFNNLGS